MDAPATTAQLQELLNQLNAGQDAARAPLLQHSLGRFYHLARRMFSPHSDLRALNETDDLVQRALVRLHRALDTVRPPNVRAYFGLAAQQVRWVLRDMAREAAAAGKLHYCGDCGDYFSGPDTQNGTLREGEPSDLLEWTEFHAAIEALPREDRELFDLLLYQGLSQPEAADLLEVPLRTLKRRWQQARLRLREALRGQWPAL